MDARARSRLQRMSSGTTTVLPTGEVNRYQFVYDERYFRDVWHKHKNKSTGLLPASDMESDYTERVPPTLSGENGFWRHKAAPMMSDYYPPLIQWSDRFSRQPADEFYAYRLIAATHPFRAVYSVPNAISEALDIGTLFKITAKSFSELAGNSYLNYKFGFSQFVSDIQTLAQMTKFIEQRLREFESLGKKGGLRRRVFLDHQSWDLDGPQGIIWSTYGVFVSANYHSQQTRKVEGTIRWRWKPGILVSLDKLSAWNLAVQTCFDLGELDATTIWNSIPWTWLADYFVDVNSWLQANENADIVEFFDLCIVWNYKHIVDIEPHLLNGDEATYRVLGGRFKRTIHARDYLPTLANVPQMRYSFLSKSQYLVLLSLYGHFRGGSY